MIELFLLPTAKHSLQTLPAWEADVFECISWLATCPFRHMDVSLTIVTPAMAFDGRRETNTARRAFAAAWAQPVDVTVLVPQDVGVAPWSLVHLREQRQASNSFAAHATAVNVHSTAVLLDVGDFSSIDCTFADWAFLAVEELQGHRGLAGATLAPAAALHRNVPSTVPFSRAFAHAHPGAGGYLPAPRVWNAFVQWAANGRGDDASSSRRAHSEGPRALLKALQQRLQAAAQVQGLVDDSVGVAFSQWAWSLHFPHLEELSLRSCKQLSFIPATPSLRKLTVDRRLLATALPCCPQLTALHVDFGAGGPTGAERVPTFCPLPASIEELHLRKWQQSELLELGLTAAPKLSLLSLDKCACLTSIPSMPSLRRLDITECSHIASLPTLPRLETLRLTFCHGLLAVPPLPALKSLHVLGCHRLKRVADLAQLEKLLVHRAVGLTSISNLPLVRDMTVVAAASLQSISRVPALKELFLCGRTRPEVMPEGDYKLH